VGGKQNILGSGFINLNSLSWKLFSLYGIIKWVFKSNSLGNHCLFVILSVSFSLITFS